MDGYAKPLYQKKAGSSTVEAKEKRWSASVWIVLLISAFALLLFVRFRIGEPTAGYSIRTQYTAEGEMAGKRERIDVNTANAQELEMLTGVGPQLAAQIVKDREENGPFETLEDLLRVKGVGESKIEEFRYEVIIGGET